VKWKLTEGRGWDILLIYGVISSSYHMLGPESSVGNLAMDPG